MTKQESLNQNKNSFKIIIILLAFTMLGSLFYIYKVSDRSKKMIISLRAEKLDILKDLEKSDLFLQQLMTSNKSLSNKLALEQNKVKQLILELRSKDINEQTLDVYKKSASNTDDRIKLLINEINKYKNRIDSTNVVLKKTNIVLNKTNDDLNNAKTKNDTLTKSNKKLVKTIESASKLYFYNLQTIFLKNRGSGKQIPTDKASKVDVVKISFMIAENDIIKSTSKEFYIQLIDSKNNVLGVKNTEKFGDDILIYSTALKLKYENKTMKVEGEVPVSKLEKGIVFINIFDKSKLILSSTFTLL